MATARLTAMIDIPDGGTSRDFERRVAALYRLAGGEVVHDTQIAGSQIDIVVKERTTSGSLIVRVVECKDFGSPVGVSVVRVFA